MSPSPSADETPEVRALRAQLAALGGGAAPSMPPDVAARIEAVLADEAAHAASPANASGTVLPARRDELAARRDRLRRVGVGLAAAVAAVAVTLTAVQLGVNGRSGDAGSSSGSSAGNAASGGRAASGALAGGRPVASGQNYTAARLPQQVSSLLSRSPVPPSAQEGSSDATAGGPASALQPARRGDAPAALNSLLDPAQLRGCIASLQEPAGDRPLAVDLATFEGKPALVVVLPGGAKDPRNVHVYVVGAACAAGADHLLRFQVVPRR